MRVRSCDFVGAWHPGPHAMAITVNGELTKSFEPVLTGLAKRVVNIFPEGKRALGKLIDVHGNHCFLLPVTRHAGEAVITFPVAHTSKTRADLTIIERSCHEATALCDLYGWEKVFLPRPGCGGGGLKWETVRPVIKPLLDERFVVVWMPGHDEVPKPAGKPPVKVGAVSKAAAKRMAAKKKVG